jgi:hypothetical protein
LKILELEELVEYKPLCYIVKKSFEPFKPIINRKKSMLWRRCYKSGLQDQARAAGFKKKVGRICILERSSCQACALSFFFFKEWATHHLQQ